MARTDVEAKALRRRMASMGALSGGLLTFIFVGILDELLKITAGAAIGALVGVIVWVQTMRSRRAERGRDLGDLPKAELVERARRLGIEHRSEMTKADLAAAIADREGHRDDTGEVLIGTVDVVAEKVGEGISHMKDRVRNRPSEDATPEK
ncbi:MAG: Rho termination factor N-terminal domain-containing protein [Acidimicrobiia bacterium]